MSFAAIACRESMPDLHEITDGLAASLDELLRAADAAGQHQPELSRRG